MFKNQYNQQINLDGKPAGRDVSDSEGVAMTTVDLSGQTLTELRVEFSAVLTFTGGFVVLLVSAFTLESQGGATRLKPDADPPEAFAQMRTLVGKAVAKSGVSDTGTLSLTFDDGSHVVAEPDGDYEAWNVSGPHGLPAGWGAGDLEPRPGWVCVTGLLTARMALTWPFGALGEIRTHTARVLNPFPLPVGIRGRFGGAEYHHSGCDFGGDVAPRARLFGQVTPQYGDDRVNN